MRSHNVIDAVDSRLVGRSDFFYADVSHTVAVTTFRAEFIVVSVLSHGDIYIIQTLKMLTAAVTNNTSVKRNSP